MSQRNGQVSTNLPTSVGIEEFAKSLLETVQLAADQGFVNPTDYSVAAWPVVLVSPQFTAKPAKITVCSETKQLQIHLDY